MRPGSGLVWEVIERGLGTQCSGTTSRDRERGGIPSDCVLVRFGVKISADHKGSARTTDAPFPGGEGGWTFSGSLNKLKEDKGGHTISKITCRKRGTNGGGGAEGNGWGGGQKKNG